MPDSATTYQSARCTIFSFESHLWQADGDVPAAATASNVSHSLRGYASDVGGVLQARVYRSITGLNLRQRLGIVKKAPEAAKPSTPEVPWASVVVLQLTRSGCLCRRSS